MLGIVYDQMACAVAGRVELIQHVDLQRSTVDSWLQCKNMAHSVVQLCKAAVSNVLLVTN